LNITFFKASAIETPGESGVVFIGKLWPMKRTTVDLIFSQRRFQANCLKMCIQSFQKTGADGGGEVGKIFNFFPCILEIWVRILGTKTV
jgi:hypothetical protein